MLSPTVSGVSYRRVFDVEGFRAECRVVGHRDHFAAVTLIQFHSCRIMRKPNPSRRSMDTEAIIKELEAEKARLDQAITALWGDKARTRKASRKHKWQKAQVISRSS
jgi:hypothetical protein